jgi:hypothetical protein
MTSGSVSTADDLAESLADSTLPVRKAISTILNGMAGEKSCVNLRWQM